MDPTQTKHGQFSWNELLTTDPGAATKFYTQLFGWTTQEMPMPDFTYTIVKHGDTGAREVNAPGMVQLRNGRQRRCDCETGGTTWRENHAWAAGHPRSGTFCRNPGPARRGYLHHYLPEEIAGLNMSKAFQNLCLQFGQFWKAFRYAKGVRELSPGVCRILSGERE